MGIDTGEASTELPLCAMNGEEDGAWFGGVWHPFGCRWAATGVFQTPQAAAPPGILLSGMKKSPASNGEAGSARGRKNSSEHTASSLGAWLIITYA